MYIQLSLDSRGFDYGRFLKSPRVDDFIAAEIDFVFYFLRTSSCHEIVIDAICADSRQFDGDDKNFYFDYSARVVKVTAL